MPIITLGNPAPLTRLKETLCTEDSAKAVVVREATQTVIPQLSQQEIASVGRMMVMASPRLVEIREEEEAHVTAAFDGLKTLGLMHQAAEFEVDVLTLPTIAAGIPAKSVLTKQRICTCLHNIAHRFVHLRAVQRDRIRDAMLRLSFENDRILWLAIQSMFCDDGDSIVNAPLTQAEIFAPPLASGGGVRYYIRTRATQTADSLGPREPLPTSAPSGWESNRYPYPFDDEEAVREWLRDVISSHRTAATWALSQRQRVPSATFSLPPERDVCDVRDAHRLARQWSEKRNWPASPPQDPEREFVIGPGANAVHVEVAAELQKMLTWFNACIQAEQQQAGESDDSDYSDTSLANSGPVPDPLVAPETDCDRDQRLIREEAVKVLQNAKLEPPDDLTFAQCRNIVTIDLYGLEDSTTLNRTRGEVMAEFKTRYPAFIDSLGKSEKDISAMISGTWQRDGKTRIEKIRNSSANQ